MVIRWQSDQEGTRGRSTPHRARSAGSIRGADRSRCQRASGPRAARPLATSGWPLVDRDISQHPAVSDHARSGIADPAVLPAIPHSESLAARRHPDRTSERVTGACIARAGLLCVGPAPARAPGAPSSPLAQALASQGSGRLCWRILGGDWQGGRAALPRVAALSARRSGRSRRGCRPLRALARWVEGASLAPPTVAPPSSAITWSCLLPAASDASGVPTVGAGEWPPGWQDRDPWVAPAGGTRDRAGWGMGCEMQMSS